MFAPCGGLVVKFDLVTVVRESTADQGVRILHIQIFKQLIFTLRIW